MCIRDRIYCPPTSKNYGWLEYTVGFWGTDRCHMHWLCKGIWYCPSPHRLRFKLKTYSINTDLIAWITDFLCNRKQCVVLNGEQSSWFKVLSGIPQGTILGPLLFLIYIYKMTYQTSVQRKILILKYIYMQTIQRYTKSFELEVTNRNYNQYCICLLYTSPSPRD